METNRSTLPVVIVGGGFAGVTLAQHLERELDPSIEIVVISRDNHLVFTPMLAEVAARTISPLHVVVAGRQMTRRTRWIAATTTAIDLNGKVISFELNHGEVQSLPYGDLVVACGMEANLGEIPGLAAHALSLKSLQDAFNLGDALIGQFERAAAEPDPAVQAKLLTTVVLGGGFSGAEVAGHLHDLAKSMRSQYRLAVEPRTIVVQRGERIIPELQHATLSEFALRKLRANGVEVLLKSAVREVTKSQVHLQGGCRLDYGLLIVTVGNTANALVRNSQLPLDRNRIKTNPTMQVEDREGVWALGDCAYILNQFNGKPSPPTAQFALRQAKQLAANIRRARMGQPLAPFRFRPQGLLASIGHRNGVAEIYGVKFSGIVAWFLWRAVYFMKMPTLSRKLGIAVDWLMDAFFPHNLVRVGDRESTQIRREHYAPGDVVYRQGESSRTLYVVESGSAMVRVDGNDQPVARLQKGERFGLSAVEREDTVHSTTVIAETALDLVAFDRPWRRDIAREAFPPEIAQQLERRHIRQFWSHASEPFPGAQQLLVADAILRDAPVLGPHETLAAAVEKLSTAVSVAVLDDDRRLIGMVRREDVIDAIAQGMDPRTPARQCSSPVTFTLSPTQTLRQAGSEYLKSGQDFVPVVDDQGRFLGMFGLIEAAKRFMNRPATADEPVTVESA
jgi:NADH dehydrogenase